MQGHTVSNTPRILETYLFCCPNLDFKFRCLPRAGGYYDQTHSDMLRFRIIEKRLREIYKRKVDKEGNK